MPSVASSNRDPKNIYDYRKITLTIPSGDKTSGYFNVPSQCNGQLLSLETVCPDLNDDANFKVHLLTPDGSNLIGTLFDTITENSTVLTQVIDTIRRCLTGQEQVQVSCLTNQTDDREITLIFGISSVGL